MDDTIYGSELSGEKYIIYEVKHTAKEIQKAYADIFPCLIHCLINKNRKRRTRCDKFK